MAAETVRASFVSIDAEGVAEASAVGAEFATMRLEVCTGRILKQWSFL